MVKKSIVEEAVRIANSVRMQDTGYRIQDKNKHASCIMHRESGIIEVKEIKNLKAGIVITGNEVYYGRIKDAFAPVITKRCRNMAARLWGYTMRLMTKR